MTDIITMPESLYKISAQRFNPVFRNLESPGTPFNPSARITGSNAVFWQADLTFIRLQGRPATDDELSDMRRFLIKLRGGRVLARLYDKNRPIPRGAGGLSTTVNVKTTVATGAESVTLKNLKVSQSPVFKPGDFFGHGENLYMIEDSVDSDVNGEATVYFNPPARKAMAAGDAINLYKPTGLFRLTDGSQDLTVVSPNRSAPFTLSFTEEPDFD